MKFELLETKEKIGLISLLSLILFASIGLLLLEPIAQDTNYHLFVDDKKILGVPNFWNVISNIAFFVVGIIGLFKLIISHKLQHIKQMKTAYLFLFFGISLVSFGSGYYHLEPNNHTLLWDRLPMTIAFMALFSVLIAEFISIRVGRILLYPLMFLGMLSVLYWYWSELNGQGDLRFYALVQFIPIMSFPIILLCFKSNYSTNSGYWFLLLAYVVAKLLEHFDFAVYDGLVLMSGHSLKHLVAAFGVYLLVRTFSHREYTKNL